MYREYDPVAEAVHQTSVVISYAQSRLDKEFFLQTVAPYQAVLFVEDGVLQGGISQVLESLLIHQFPEKKTRIHALPDRFLAVGKRAEILEDCGLDAKSLAKSAQELMEGIAAIGIKG